MKNFILSLTLGIVLTGSFNAYQLQVARKYDFLIKQGMNVEVVDKLPKYCNQVLINGKPDGGCTLRWSDGRIEIFMTKTSANFERQIIHELGHPILKSDDEVRVQKWADNIIINANL